MSMQVNRVNRILGHFSSPTPLEQADRNLIHLAKRFLIIHQESEGEEYRQKHFVLALVLMRSGKIFYGMNIKANMTLASICAEKAVLARIAVVDPKGTIDTIVVVMLHPKTSKEGDEPTIATPCGNCRDLLVQFAPDAMVILNEQEKDLAKNLLPYPYKEMKIA